SSASALAALRFLALAPCGRPLVELAAAGLGEDSGLLDLLVESAKRCLKRLAITNDHFRQRLLVTPPSFQKETGPAEAGHPNNRCSCVPVKMRMFTKLAQAYVLYGRARRPGRRDLLFSGVNLVPLLDRAVQGSRPARIRLAQAGRLQPRESGDAMARRRWRPARRRKGFRCRGSH